MTDRSTESSGTQVPWNLADLWELTTDHYPDREALVDLQWLIAKGYRRYQPMRRDGRQRVTLASVPDSVSASRYAGKKNPREGP